MKMTTVYRSYDAEDRLLYVGCTDRVRPRMRQHRSNSAWWDEMVRVDLKRFVNRTLALDAEATAIHKEKPRCNVQGKNFPPVLIGHTVPAGVLHLNFQVLLMLQRRGLTAESVAERCPLSADLVQAMFDGTERYATGLTVAMLAAGADVTPSLLHLGRAS